MHSVRIMIHYNLIKVDYPYYISPPFDFLSPQIHPPWQEESSLMNTDQCNINIQQDDTVMMTSLDIPSVTESSQLYMAVRGLIMVVTRVSAWMAKIREAECIPRLFLCLEIHDGEILGSSVSWKREILRKNVICWDTQWESFAVATLWILTQPGVVWPKYQQSVSIASAGMGSTIIIVSWYVCRPQIVQTDILTFLYKCAIKMFLMRSHPQCDDIWCMQWTLRKIYENSVDLEIYKVLAVSPRHGCGWKRVNF